MNAFRTYQSLAGKLNYALFLALLIALPLPRMILQPIAVAWIISWVLECRFLNKERWHWNKQALPGILLVLLTVWEAISLLWAPDTQAGLRIIERHWPFIILVLIPIFGVNEHFRTEKMLPTLFAACVASVPLYLFVSYWVWNADAVIWFDHSALRPFEFPSIHGITSLMKLRSFYCIILMLSILSSPLLYRIYCRIYPKWEVLLTLGIADLVMVSGMLMSGSRSGLLTLVIAIAFLMFVMYRHKLKWWMQLLIIVVGLGVTVPTIIANPRFSTFLAPDIHNLDLSEASGLTEPRFYIWTAVVEHWQDYGSFGLGAGQHIEFMLERYREAGNDLFLNLEYGPHNQYFGFWMCLGPLAALLLLAAFILIPRVYRGAGRYTAHAFAFVFAFSMLSDDLLERMDSILIFLVWMVLLYVIESTGDKPIAAAPSLQSDSE